MTFKADWEIKATTHQLPNNLIKQMTQLAYPNKKLISHELIAEGCANLNIKILFEDEKHPFILRIYLRDKNAAFREQKLGTLLKHNVPVPLTYFIGETDGYLFAITEFMPGISLRTLLLGNLPYDMSAIMYDVGCMLSKVSIKQFSHAGFFDKELNVTPLSSSDSYLAFFKNCLAHKNVILALNPKVIIDINVVLNNYSHLLPDEKENHLVHADFDPANILVNEIDGNWKVSGILDWEFAFSGARLWDVANMLRYAHKMPPEFQDAFLKGLIDGGTTLGDNWQITVHLLNLMALLDFLKRSHSLTSPNQCKDIKNLIDNILFKISMQN